MGLFRELLKKYTQIFFLLSEFYLKTQYALVSDAFAGSFSLTFSLSVPQSCPILCDPMVCSLLGSPVHGIFQARILVWVAVSLSGGSNLLGHTFNCQLRTCPKGVTLSAFQVSYLSPLSGCLAYSHVKE